MSFLGAITKPFVQLAETVIPPIVHVAEAVAAPVVHAAEAVVHTVDSAATTVDHAVLRPLGKAIHSVAQDAAHAADTAATAIDHAVLRPLGKAVHSGAQDAAHAADTAATAIDHAVLKPVEHAAEAVYTSTADIATSILDRVGDAAHTALDKIGDGADAALHAVGEVGDAAFDIAGDAAKDVLDVTGDVLAPVFGDGIDRTLDGVGANIDEGLDIAGHAVQGAADVAGTALDDAADWTGKATETVTDYAHDLVEHPGDTIVKSAEDVGEFISDHSKEILVGLEFAGKLAATAIGGPLGGAIVGAALSAAHKAADGGDIGDVSEATLFGAANGAAASSPVARELVGFSQDVANNAHNGMDFGDSVTNAAQRHDVDAFNRAADTSGIGPIGNAGVHAGVATLQGGDASEIAGASAAGFAQSWVGDTVPGAAIAGATGGLVTGLTQGHAGSELFADVGQGAWQGVLERNPGLDLGIDTVDKLVHGAPLPQVIMGSGKLEGAKFLETVGVDHPGAELISSVGIDSATGLAQAKSWDEVGINLGGDLGLYGLRESGLEKTGDSWLGRGLTRDTEAQFEQVTHGKDIGDAAFDFGNNGGGHLLQQFHIGNGKSLTDDATGFAKQEGESLWKGHGLDSSPLIDAYDQVSHAHWGT